VGTNPDIVGSHIIFIAYAHEGHVAWAAMFAGCCGFVILVKDCLWAVVTGSTNGKDFSNWKSIFREK
jgi:hypothetical protein